MNKSDLIDSVAASAGLSKTDAESAVTAVFHAIGNTLQKGLPVSVVGFGNFKLTRRAARLGKHPQTGASISINASNGVNFKPAKSLKDSLQQAAIQE